MSTRHRTLSRVLVSFANVLNDPNPAPAPAPPAPAPEPKPDEPKPTPTPSTFTQEELEAELQKRFDSEFGKRKSKWESDVKAFLEAEGKKQGMEGDAADLVAAAEAAANEKVSASNKRIRATEAKVAALSAGVKPERAATFLRLVDLDTVPIDEDGVIDEAALKAAVETTLTENPEFKGAAATPGAAGALGSEHGGNGGPGKVWTREEVGKLSPEEYEEHAEEIEAQMRAGTLK